MKNKLAIIILPLFFIIIFLIFYLGLKNSNVYIPKKKTLRDIPNFSSKIFDTKIEISSKKIFQDNQFYLFNIWSSWCVPCRKEHSFLMYLKKQKNLEIIGLNYKDKNDNAKIFLNELGNPFELIISDKDGTIAIDWGAYGVPESFLVHNKKILKKIIGPIDEKTLPEIEELIK